MARTVARRRRSDPSPLPEWILTVTLPLVLPGVADATR
jgi:hypothetical protein